MLQDIVAAEVGQGECRVVLARVRLHCCPEEQDREAFVLVYPLAHCGDEVGLRDVLSTSRQETMVGQCVQAWARASNYKDVSILVAVFFQGSHLLSSGPGGANAGIWAETSPASRTINFILEHKMECLRSD